MVEKINLKRTPHPTPYRVSWLNKGQRVLVNEQSWVEFHNEGYKDKILCDVIPMYAFDLLLGIPWKYDHREHHDGQKNNYTIEKDGESFTLNPLPNEGADKKLGSSVMVVGEKEFLRTLKEEGDQGFSLIFKPKYGSILSTNNGETILSDVQTLLEKYKGIVVEELPSALHPIKDTNHHMDLILGATLPNKDAYKMTPAQNEEIAKEVQ
ncbi:uncharacterized protein LOC131875147 [Cryptomeria japonica]|uniref:uncharacterized protein LOC131875147 n=1 Tax=Cryptomeria japonica TaxID=3369 RepID=UPI0027DA91FF|nr:uncharacterized protein LOC131875147 [Cryptomeria japonica]